MICIKRARGLTKVANIPEITKQAPLIEQILHTDYLDRADVNDFEKIRKNLRDLDEVHSERVYYVMRRIWMMKFYLRSGTNRSSKMMI